MQASDFTASILQANRRQLPATQDASLGAAALQKALAAACCRAFGCALPGSCVDGVHRAAAEQPDGSCGAADAAAQATPSPPLQPRRLMVFNLFALDAYHLAEALQVSCVAAHPYLIPYTAPSGLRRRFQRGHPRLYQRLAAAADAGDAGLVSWAEVRARAHAALPLCARILVVGLLG